MSSLQLPPALVKRTLSNSAVEERGAGASVSLTRFSSMSTRRSFITRQRHHTLPHWFVSDS